LMSSYSRDIPSLELTLNGLPARRRLRLDQPRIPGVMQDCAAEVSALSAALGSQPT
jgi:hypothetical protein